jgi:hypothetical protein
MDCIFDRQDNFGPLAIQMWNYMKDQLEWETGKHLGGISFYSRFERVSLQAADMLSHCLYHVEAYRKDTDKYEVAYVLHHITKNGMDVKKLDQETVEMMLPGYPPSLRELDEKRRQLMQSRGATGGAAANA